LKLFVLTDTRVKKINERFFIFNAVKFELDAINSLFSEVALLGGDYSNVNEINTLEICSTKWIIRSLHFPEQNDIKNSFFLLLKLLKQSINQVRKADIIHVRGPGIPMFVGLIYCIIFPNKIWWFKYANDWSSWGKSNFWDLQKLLLSKFFWIKVTINGKWLNQPKHILSFENPCIWEVSNKSYHNWLNKETRNIKFIYVGRLTNEKGILIAIKCFESFCRKQGSNVHITYTIIGDGPLKNYCANYKSELENLKINFLGTLSKTQIFEFYKLNHFIVLPTSSPEGFPKSIAEAMSFGCIPIVTAVSSIPQYITNGENGFLISKSLDKIALEFEQTLNNVIDFEKGKLIDISNNARLVAEENFTYNRFTHRVKSELIN
jgi:glycosyltransferase involved in cell wall biosynthesis